LSRIGDLIAEHCSNGVEVRALGEVGEFVRGNGLQKKDLLDEGESAIHYGQVFTIYGTATRQTVSFVERELARRLRRARPGDLVIATTSENDADVCKAVAWLGDTEAAVSGDAFIYRHTLDPLYASYFFQSSDFRAQKQRYISGTKVRRVSGSDLARIQIPVPPIAAQREISSVLERMEDLQSGLEVELEAELEARRMQYEHYRAQLLVGRGVAHCRSLSLGELVRVRFGERITKAKDTGSAYPVYGGGGESFRTDAFNRQDEWVVSRFAMSERCVRRVAGKFWLLDSGFTFDTISPDVDKDYVGQMLLHLQPLIFMTSTQSAQKNIDIQGFKRIQVLLPSMAEQRSVVKALESFDALVRDLSAGLPAEVAARRQQYEYHRDRLLTFREETR
jgi:type I restriction enzyme S subunit